MLHIDSKLRAQADSSRGSPYRICAPSPKDPPAPCIHVPPERAVFVLLILAGLVWFFRERPGSENDGGPLNVAASPAPFAYGRYSPPTRDALLLGSRSRLGLSRSVDMSNSFLPRVQAIGHSPPTSPFSRR
jgi:hypothetical protein